MRDSSCDACVIGVAGLECIRSSSEGNFVWETWKCIRSSSDEDILVSSVIGVIDLEMHQIEIG